MNYREINMLKDIFSNILKYQQTLRSIDIGMDGKLITIGYNPYWTGLHDSKIDKMELNFLCKRGKIVPLILRNIVDFELYPKEGRKNKKYRVQTIELVLLSPFINPRNDKDIYDKVSFEIIYED